MRRIDLTNTDGYYLIQQSVVGDKDRVETYLVNDKLMFSTLVHQRPPCDMLINYILVQELISEHDRHDKIAKTLGAVIRED